MAELSDEDRRKLKQELVKVGLRTMREAKRNCPVDTGRLRSSITVADSEGIIQDIGSDAFAGDEVDAPGDKFVVRVGSNVSYAAFVEFGTENMPAQPFLRPARNEVSLDLST